MTKEDMQSNDNLVATMISQCAHIMRDYDTLSRVTASYNLLVNNFRLCCVQGDPDQLKIIAEDIYNGLKQEIIIDEDEDDSSLAGGCKIKHMREVQREYNIRKSESLKKIQD